MPESVAVIAAMASSAEWLNADACALLLGMATPKGAVNRRGFLERVAPRGTFPKPLVIVPEKKWKRSEVAQVAAYQWRIIRTPSLASWAVRYCILSVRPGRSTHSRRTVHSP